MYYDGRVPTLVYWLGEPKATHGFQLRVALPPDYDEKEPRSLDSFLGDPVLTTLAPGSLLEIDPSEDTDEAPYTPEQFIESSHSAVSGTGPRVLLGRFRAPARRKTHAEACRIAHENVEFYIGLALQDAS
ncbi:hypothetical protein PSPO01_05815 [Paraphaeosphaeria sporulosa]